MMSELIMEGVCYRYPGTKKEILTGVDAVFRPGTVTTIMGRSGAGKSTLLYLLAGLDIPTAGRILYGLHSIRPSALSFRRFPHRT